MNRSVPGLGRTRLLAMPCSLISLDAPARSPLHGVANSPPLSMVCTPMIYRSLAGLTQFLATSIQSSEARSTLSNLRRTPGYTLRLLLQLQLGLIAGGHGWGDRKCAFLQYELYWTENQIRLGTRVCQAISYSVLISPNWFAAATDFCKDHHVQEALYGYLALLLNHDP